MRVGFVLVLLAVTACAAARVTERVDGSYVIKCAQKKSCESRAERLCGSEGYRLIGGRHDQKLYGTPGNQVVVGKDELYVRCNSDRAVDEPDVDQGSWKLPHRKDRGEPAKKAAPAGSVALPSPAATTEQSEPAAASTAASAGAVTAICRPGETQRCVGPAACAGGQACLSDGSAFGPCDCGTATPTGK